jgi:hypothetical protein
MIQCQGDLSPVPLFIQKEIIIDGEPIYLAQGAKHTCRKFENIISWLEERDKKYGAVGEYDNQKGEPAES